eukprot:1157258-Pelagomonas_calceolata.AAC.2
MPFSSAQFCGQGRSSKQKWSHIKQPSHRVPIHSVYTRVVKHDWNASPRGMCFKSLAKSKGGPCAIQDQRSALRFEQGRGSCHLEPRISIEVLSKGEPHAIQNQGLGQPHTSEPHGGGGGGGGGSFLSLTTGTDATLEPTHVICGGLKDVGQALAKGGSARRGGLRVSAQGSTKRAFIQGPVHTHAERPRCEKTDRALI